MKSFLIETKGQDPVKIKIEKDKISIGRKEDNDIVLNDIYVSRYHASIEKREGNYYIIDLESTYGTFLNEEKVTFARIKHGDRIKLGNTTITFIEEDKFENIKTNIVELTLGTEDENFKKIIKLIEEGIRDTAIQEIKKWYITTTKSKKIIETMYDIAKTISSSYDINQLLNLSLDLALKLLAVERGFISFIKDGKLEIKVVRMIGKRVVDDLMISSNIMEEVIKTRKGLLISNAMRDPKFSQFRSVQLYKLKSIIAVPLISRTNEVFGVIYIDDINSPLRKTFSDDDLEFMEMFANHISLAIENLKLYERIKEEEKKRENLERYLSPSLTQYMLSSKRSLKEIEGEKDIIIMFADIREFTDIANKLKPDDVVKLLNMYFSEITDIVFKYDGMIDKFIGDAIMVLFGIPISKDDTAIKAVKTGLDIVKYIKKFKKELSYNSVYKNIADIFDVGVGIAAGKATVGNIGSKKRMDFTAIGNPVNLAARLSNTAEPGEIIISEEVFNRTYSMGYRYKKKTSVYIKGFADKITLYSIKV